MLVFSAQSLAFIAVPKTGTTAVERTLGSKADIIFTKRYKHMTAARFHTRIAPLLKQAYDLAPDRMAVMRNPEEQIRSWFRYRRRDGKANTKASTDGLSFDEFVLAVISDDRPPFARIGSQYKMLTSGSGDLLVHHLFAHAQPDTFEAFLSDRFAEDITLKHLNVSPQVDAPLDPAIRAKLQAARAPEFDLYARLTDAGGHLQTTIS